MSKTMLGSSKATMNKIEYERVSADVPSRRRSRWVAPLRVVVVAGACLGSVDACGAKAGGGNTGSETHWLGRCDAESYCAEGSCTCGFCTAACVEDDDCARVEGSAARCVVSAEIPNCSAEATARLCVAVSAGSSDSAVSRSDAGPMPSSGDGAPPVELERICDGSDDLRFFMSTAGGFVDNLALFVAPYGYRFIAIDGRCRFWLSNLSGVVEEGQLEEPSLLAGYEATGFGRLQTVPEYTGGYCADATSTLLWDPLGALNVPDCGATEENSPPGLLAIAASARRLYAALAPYSKPSTSPTRILIEASESIAASGTPWPLDLNPTHLLQFRSPYDPDLAGPNAGVSIPPGPELDALRAARQQSSRVTFSYERADALPVTFTAYFRDELPQDVSAALARIKSELAVATGGLANAACTSNGDCGGLICAARDLSGDAACNACISSDSAPTRCDENADCCGGSTCCVDCGDLSGTCLRPVDPCGDCLAAGGVWAGDERCLGACPDEGVCFASACPGACGRDACGNCTNRSACWFADCDWLQPVGNLVQCVAPERPAPCEVEVTDPSLPGVTLRLEAERCSALQGQGIEFRYRVEFAEPIAYEAPAYEGCDACYTTWVPRFQITGEESTYCPLCDSGCCSAVDAHAESVDASTYEQVLFWPGLEWNGPTQNDVPPAGLFTPGTYEARVLVSLGNLGQLEAKLPITVVARAE